MWEQNETRRSPPRGLRPNPGPEPAAAWRGRPRFADKARHLTRGAAVQEDGTLLLTVHNRYPVTARGGDPPMELVQDGSSFALRSQHTVDFKSFLISFAGSVPPPIVIYVD